MTIPISKGDYIIAEDEGKRRLLRVTSVREGTFKAVRDGKSMSSPDTLEKVELSHDDIMCNLGSDPKLGYSAFGVRVEPYVDHVALKNWGSVYYFRTLTETENKAFKLGLSSVYSFLSSHKLTSHLPIEIEVRNAQGKYAGLYKYSGSDDRQDILVFKPESMTSGIQALIAHEIGHHIYFRYMGSTQKAERINKYHKDVSLSRVDVTAIRSFGLALPSTFPISLTP